MHLIVAAFCGVLYVMVEVSFAVLGPAKAGLAMMAVGAAAMIVLGPVYAWVRAREKRKEKRS